jgi:hypothetical protein
MKVLEETETQYLKLRLSSVIFLSFILITTGSMSAVLGFAYGYKFYLEERINQETEAEFYEAKIVDKAENPRFY